MMKNKYSDLLTEILSEPIEPPVMEPEKLVLYFKGYGACLTHVRELIEKYGKEEESKAVSSVDTGPFNVMS